ncbi:MAG: GWxTD domain-containing protein [Bacteroidetes Order II. Incertae sedis bacterium]|nr:GWxTD domain-containing protein [Bacteroidetes Order II. bacterium]
MRRLTIILLLSVFGPTILFAQSMTRSERVSIVTEAIKVADWDLAAFQTDEILSRWPKDPDGLLFLAEISLFGPVVDPPVAKRALRRLPKSERSRLRALELDLWRDYRYGSGLFPTAKVFALEKRALNLLEAHPESVLGNLTVGMIKLEDYRREHNRFIGQSSLQKVIHQVTVSLAGTSSLVGYQPEEAATGNTHGPQMRPEIESAAREDALHYLFTASLSGNMREFTLRMLAEASLRAKSFEYSRSSGEEFIKDYPDKVLGYQIVGMSHYFQGDHKSATKSLNHSLTLMDDETRWVFTNPQMVTSTSRKGEFEEADAAQTEDFWAGMDYLWSTPDNERLVEHQVRTVAADLMWGRPSHGYRGWETRPGEVYIRYGLPLIQVQIGSSYVLHYGFRYWVFTDIMKYGTPIFHSNPNMVPCHLRGRGVPDFSKCSKEWFRDDPERSQHAERLRFELNATISTFKTTTGKEVVVAYCFPETDQPPGQNVAFFVRKQGGPVPENYRLLDILRRKKHWSEMPCDVPHVIVHPTENGNQQISLEIEDIRGFATFRDKVSDPIGPIAVSSLVLATLVEESDEIGEFDANTNAATTGTSFSRNGHTIYPVAVPSFDRGSPIYLYFESYPEQQYFGSDIMIQAALVSGTLEDDLMPTLGRIFGRRESAAVSVEFDDQFHSNPDPRYLILETEEVRSGTYVLAVRITHKETGAQTLVRRQIEVN